MKKSRVHIFSLLSTCFGSPLLSGSSYMNIHADEKMCLHHYLRDESHATGLLKIFIDEVKSCIACSGCML